MCGRVCFLVGEQSRISRLSQISHMLITQMKSRPGRSIWRDSSPVSACSKRSYFLFSLSLFSFPHTSYLLPFVRLSGICFFFFFFLILQFRWPDCQGLGVQVRKDDLGFSFQGQQTTHREARHQHYSAEFYQAQCPEHSFSRGKADIWHRVGHVCQDGIYHHGGADAQL